VWLPISAAITVAGMLVSSFLVVAAIIGMFGVETRKKHVEEISP
jgi:hypothetical protein